MNARSETTLSYATREILGLDIRWLFMEFNMIPCHPAPRDRRHGTGGGILQPQSRNWKLEEFF